jgi:hypothetical protein
MKKISDSSVYEAAAKDFIKVFREPSLLVLFLSELSYLTAGYLFDKKEELNITEIVFYDSNYRVLRLLDTVAVEWISNVKNPVPVIAKSLR